jgi:uncharacterized surface protein with fasciclin (FAS1) repeats
MKMFTTIFFATSLWSVAMACPQSDDQATASEAPATIAATAAATSDFTTLTQALGAANLVQTLKGDGPFTVFAPTNAAFSDLDPATLRAALDDPNGLLKDVLTYHVVAGAVRADQVVNLTSVKTVNGAELSIEVVNGAVMLNGTTRVTTTDIECANGIIHIIDHVLLPEAQAASAKSIVETAQSNRDFSTLVTAVGAAELVQVLSGEGPFTVFAPTNAAFENLDANTLKSALEDPRGLLRDVLTYHVLPGRINASQVVSLSSATTVQGDEIRIAVVDGVVTLNGSARVTTADVECGNGVIHIIDGVLLPGS